MQGSSYDLALELSEGGDYEVPEEGKYNIRFDGVIDKKEWPNDKTGEVDVSLTLQFTIDEPDNDWNGVEFRDYFPLRVTAKNKSGRLWAALLGVEPDALPAPLPKTSSFVGKRCGATIIHRNAANGNTYAKIASVGPLKGRRGAPPRRLLPVVDAEPIEYGDDDAPNF